MAKALAVVSPIMTVFSGFQEASAIEKQGKRQQEMANLQAQHTRDVAERNALIATDQAAYKAERLKTEAIQEQAIAQRSFIEKRRQSRLAESRAVAVAGASGGGVGDPTVLNIISELAGEGEFGAQSALFEGESAASLLNTEAALALYEGEQRSTNILYSGSEQAGLKEYEGASARYSSKVSARDTRIAAIGKAVSQASSGLTGKYGGQTGNQKVEFGDYASAGARRDISYAKGGGYGPYRY